MRFSSYFIPTLKEVPADAEIISHKLLLRAGMIRRLTSGLYTYLPLGLRLIRRIENIIREEMNRAGFQELLMPMVQPADLWRETGRWDFYGRELLRFKDRNNRDYCLGPTHEEVITDLARCEVRSYRQLPLRLYQIQTKFRDEIRPRFGLMRGREFIMKDAYSFDANVADAEKSYKLMHDTYMRIFERLGLRFRAVEADTGSIGGNFSHEFMVLADTGEDSIAVCDQCDYAANVERAEIKPKKTERKKGCATVEEVLTPNAHAAKDVANLLGIPLTQLVKTMLFVADEKPVAALVRGDRDVNEIKLKKLLNVQTLELASPQIVEDVTHAPLGFAGPLNLNIPIYADNELMEATDYVTGANKKDTHLLHVDIDRDVKIKDWGDLRIITEKDSCPRCGGKIKLTRGIEVGHIFMLGQKYTNGMHAVFLDENGKEQCLVSGCYGIGVSRIASAAIEQNHDEKGILFPPAISPIDCILINLDPRNLEVSNAVEKIYKALTEKGMEVLLDDRQERPGVKFNDADLLGAPLQILVGAKSMAAGVAEGKDRRSGIKTNLPLENFMQHFNQWQNEVENGWKNLNQ